MKQKNDIELCFLTVLLEQLIAYSYDQDFN